MEEKWFVIRVYTGHENKVESFLKAELRDNEKLAAKIRDILVPLETIVEVKNGKKKIKKKNFFPGYILIQADIDLAVKDFILNTPSVMGFLGSKDNPSPLQPEEAKRIVGRIRLEQGGERVEAGFKMGDIVKIVDGPFNNFTGTVEEVNEDKMKIKVSVSIFGRKTPVEIDFLQAELQK